MATRKEIFLSIGKEFFTDRVIAETPSDNFHAFKLINPIKRRIGKDTITYGNVHLFVSGRMYPNTNRDFAYAILYQSNTIKPYRKQHTYVIEGNKQFFSAKTQKQLLIDIKKNANLTNFTVS